MKAGRRAMAADMAAACLRHVAASAAGLLTIPLVGHGLGAEALGLWAVLGTSSFLIGVGDLGLGVVVQRAGVRKDEPAVRRAVGLALLAIALTGPVLALLIKTFLLDIDAGAFASELSMCAVIVLLAGFVQAWGSPYRALLTASGGMRGLAMARVVSSILQVSMTAVGLALYPSLLVPTTALLVALSVEVVLWIRAARSAFPSVPLMPLRPTSREEVKVALREGAASFAINAAGLAALRFDVMLLARVSPLAAVAAYGVASRVVDQSFTIAKQVSTALLPRLGDRKERDDAVRTGTAVLGGLVAAGMVVLMVVGKPLIVAWAGEAAEQPELMVALALLAATAIIAAHHETAAASLLLSAPSGWAAATPLVIGYVVNIALSATFVWSFGVWAVAGGTLIGTALSSVLIWSRAQRLLDWTPSTILRTLMPGMATALAAGLFALPLRGAVEASWITSIVVCAVAGLGGLLVGALVARRSAWAVA